MQKGAGGSLDPDDLAVPGDGEGVERLFRRLGLAFGGAEGGEVVMADKHLRRLVHSLRVEGTEHAPGALTLQG